MPGPEDTSLTTPGYFERIRAASEAVAARLDATGAQVCLVLGSGLGGITDELQDARSVPYGDIPGFIPSRVVGHQGRFWVGTLGGRKVVVLAGRVHGYEGHSPLDVTLGVRVAVALGVKTLVVTNAAGGIDPAFAPGEVVLIADHLNLTGASPLTGPHDERLGPRFLDMSYAYAPGLRTLAQQVAKRPPPEGLGRPLREAVYAGLSGPAYETPAEVRMLRALGAGLVGMSTVHEVIAARHAGLEVAGFSLVTNAAAGVRPEPLSHEEVTAAGVAGAALLAPFLRTFISELPGEAGCSRSGQG